MLGGVRLSALRRQIRLASFKKSTYVPQAVDVLTPIGRGQALLVVGQQGAGKSSLVLDAILGQRDQDVQCIYASVGQR